MNDWDNFDLLSSHAPKYPYEAINGIAWRARRILKGWTNKKLTTAITAINEALEEQVTYYLEAEKASYVQSLVENGGWELSYLPLGEEVTTEAVRELIENWPSDADDWPSLQDRRDFADLDTLQDILDHWETDAIIHGVSNFEFYAVLALAKIEEAVSHLSWAQEGKGEIHNIAAEVGPIAAANAVIEAMEIICYAERTLSDEQLKEIRTEQREQFAAEVAAQARKRNSERAVAARYSPNRAAREFVQNEWAAHKNAYDGNKSAFARNYVAIVANKFTDSKGDPLKVTEKTIREVWLSDTPSTSKQAG